MDVAFYLANRFPDKVVHILNGKGTAFLNPTLVFLSNESLKMTQYL
jgi:hypothetical protein